jgi:anti-sigma B factor antagonist
VHPPPFRSHLRLAGGVARIELAGEFDMATAPEVERALEQALRAGCHRIVVDLRNLVFMDSTGLVLLARWDLGARLDGCNLALIPGREPIQRLFSITGLDRQFTFEEPG